MSSGGTHTITELSNFLIVLPQTNIATVILSIIVVVTILGSSRISKKIPGPLIAVVGTIIATLIFNFKAYGISLVGEVPSGLPSFSLPTFYISDFYTILVAASACFIVIIAQSAATSRIYAFKNSKSWMKIVTY